MNLPMLTPMFSVSLSASQEITVAWPTYAEMLYRGLVMTGGIMFGFWGMRHLADYQELPNIRHITIVMSDLISIEVNSKSNKSNRFDSKKLQKSKIQIE